ncbi:MAG: hypothetical protein ACRDDZ_05825 [Marinifilaceae bacterium]
MGNLSEFKAYSDNLQQVIGAETIIFAVTEEDAKKKIRDATGSVLIAVMPDYNMRGYQDNIRDVKTLLYLVMMYKDPKATAEEEFDIYEETEGMIIALKDSIIADAQSEHLFVRKLDYNSIAIEPQEVFAKDYVGWMFICEA